MEIFFNELKIKNQYAAELTLIGNMIRNFGNNNSEIKKKLKSNINTKTHHFDCVDT